MHTISAASVRSGIAVLVLIVGMCWGASARADDKSDCIAASMQGQALAGQHHPLAAREHFVACARTICPGPIVKDCAEQLERVDAAIPTIVLVAQTSNGEELRDARVTMDGARVADVLDGRALPVEPGQHAWDFVDKSGRSQHVELVIEEGAKLKRVVAIFMVPPSDRPKTVLKRGPIPALAGILGAIGLAAIGTGTVLGIQTLSERGELRTESDRDAFLTKQHVVDVVFGAGIAALGAATLLVVLRPYKSVPAKPNAAWRSVALF